MSEVHANNSDSALSTGSWTLLDDIPQDPIPEPDPSPSPLPDEDCNRDSGFLSFDEYLQERLLEHDYGDDPKVQQLRRTYKNKSKRGLRKCKAQHLGISVLIALVLGLSALASLCSTFSQPKIQHKEDRNHIKTVSHWKEVLDEFNKNVPQVDSRQISKVEVMNKSLPIGPVLPKNPSTFNQFRYPKCHFRDRVIPPKPKASVTAWIVFKDLVLDTQIHALISLVMTNIYLFVLFADIAKTAFEKQKTSLQPELNPEELRKFLFRELPFWNSDFVPPKKQSKSVKSICLEANEETGKSECQLRFDALDKYQKRFESLKQTQKDRIKLLKQKYKNEVALIREQEDESRSRAEKIQRTSQMFIKKLKYNRERYLMELKRMRDLRLKMQEQRRRTQEGSRDASVAVCLAPVFNYGERFKTIKEKFERESEELPKVFKF